MDTSKLRKFASFARVALIEQVGTRLKTVLAEQSISRRESPKVVAELESRINELGQQQLLETVAYTWFNRFCALRYMDVNRFTPIGVLSPADGQFQPEILSEAKMGHIDEALVPEAIRKRVMRLLDGSDPSADPQGEAYRSLLVAVCNFYHSLMPFMFEKIADYTELLLPDDLLSEASVPAQVRAAIALDDDSSNPKSEIENPKSLDVELIGWLYQFYIADKKDEVFEGLKKGKKITAENIPAATQLFTPHWIVRYLVENSLGRLWMLNHPDSNLVERMDYYIKPEERESDFLKIGSPEEIKVCDPACGSGHMLTYAFDLLYEIYREEQYPEPEIPTLILKNNLYGIEIDPRAGALAAFALTIKAREKDKRFFNRKSKIGNRDSAIQNPNLCVLENIKIDADDLSAYMDKVGRDLFTDGLKGVVNQWEEADNFGSLIRPSLTDLRDVLELLRERQMEQDLFLAKVHQQVLNALRQADYLSPKYHVVVANPPYMGARGMSATLRSFIERNFLSGRADFYSAFMLRAIDLIVSRGVAAMVTLQGWMFIPTYKDLRHELLDRVSFPSCIHIGPRGFDTISGEIVQTAAFCFEKSPLLVRDTTFVRLVEYDSELEKQRNFLNNQAKHFRKNVTTFSAIPGSPFAYQLSANQLRVFEECDTLSEHADVKEGLNTGDNERFLRYWFEVSFSRIHFDATSEEARCSKLKWFPCNKGGSFCRWFGNNDFIIDWQNDGEAIRNFRDDNGKLLSALRNPQFYFKTGLTWSGVSTSGLSVRHFPQGFVFNSVGRSLFPKKWHWYILGFLNSIVCDHYLSILAPTLHFSVSDIANMPLANPSNEQLSEANLLVEKLVDCARRTWARYESSWKFNWMRKPESARLSTRFEQDSAILQSQLNETQLLEAKLNAVYVDLYGLNGEVSLQFSRESQIPDSFNSDEATYFISHAVGCMFGRYSLDKPGLILANQGETAADYRMQIPNPTFAPDEDNVIPITEREWFSDDIGERFKEFLKTTFGTEQYRENLQFLENALYPDNATAKNRKTIRNYFLEKFYDHHLKLYKKRPIYWLFSSPKGTFNALIYMHRYRPETVGKVLECLRDFRDKLAHHAEHRQMTADSASASKTEKTQAVKEVAAIKKQLKELEDYEKTLFEVAAKKISIDLDDGVKHNYPLFGSVLRKIPGLDAKED